MQAEILDANPASRIRLFAINEAGYEAGNAVAVEGRTLPLLQDTAEAGALASWNLQYRDVLVLDGENRPLGVYNLSDHNLSVRPEYDALLDYLRIQAGE